MYNVKLSTVQFPNHNLFTTITKKNLKLREKIVKKLKLDIVFIIVFMLLFNP